MGPLTGCEPPCWERPGCLHCWLFTECYCGKPISSHKDRKHTKVHPENREQAVRAAFPLALSQIVGIFKQERDWTYEDKLWPVPEKEGCDTLYSGVKFICEDCWNLPFCKEKRAKRCRKELKREERRRKKMPPEWYGGSDDVSLKPTNTPLGPRPGVCNKKMKMGGRPMFSTPSMRGPGGLPPHTRKKGDTVAPEKPSVIKEKKGEPNLDKAKTRFRAAAWWCFGAVIGLIGGKFFVDFIVYMGMPLRPTGPEKVWAIFMWVALVAVYVCLFGAFWMGLSVIRKKFSLKTSYDMALGDVRIIKVHPDITDKLLTYEPTDKPEIEMIAEAITIDGEEIPEE